LIEDPTEPSQEGPSEIKKEVKVDGPAFAPSVEVQEPKMEPADPVEDTPPEEAAQMPLEDAIARIPESVRKALDERLKGTFARTRTLDAKDALDG